MNIFFVFKAHINEFELDIQLTGTGLLLVKLPSISSHAMWRPRRSLDKKKYSESQTIIIFEHIIYYKELGVKKKNLMFKAQNLVPDMPPSKDESDEVIDPSRRLVVIRALPNP